MGDRGAGRENFRGQVGITAAESEPWWPARKQAADGAPNVVVIALDDTGFAHFGCYGSDIDTPHIDRLAAGGLRYNNFHTTALCSPTRACLLTGRNHHSVGMRFLSNVDTGFSNCRGFISNKAATLAEMLLRLFRKMLFFLKAEMGYPNIYQASAFARILAALVRWPHRICKNFRPQRHLLNTHRQLATVGHHP